MRLMQWGFDSHPSIFFMFTGFCIWLLARLNGTVQEDLHGAWVEYLVAFLPFALEFGAHVFVFTRAGCLLPLSLVWLTLALFITHRSCFLLVQTQRHFFSSPFPLFSTQCCF
jgi:hypothetical protein